MRTTSVILLCLTAACALIAAACGQSGKPEGTTVLPTAQLPALAFTSDALPGATVDAAYEGGLALSGPAACEITAGALPPGLEMSADGHIFGTPRVTGDWPLQVCATDGRGSVVKWLTLHVAGTPGDDFEDMQLRSIAADKRILPLLTEDLPVLDAARVELGRMLFFDKELSGTRDVACASCHHPALGYGDALSFSVGVGSNGLMGAQRRHPDRVLIARNAPPIFNSGLYPAMFWDKRVRMPLDRQGRLPHSRSPVVTPEGTFNLEPDEAQALFPIADVAEMRGRGHDLDDLESGPYRQAMVERLKKIPEYVLMFEAAFGDGGMTVLNMGRAIAAFERSQTFVNSPWDRYLMGERTALTDQQKRGASLFFGRANCDNCHNGPLLTDFAVRHVGVPQFGPGKGKGAASGEDYGVEEVTGASGLRYHFKTPTLRNVSITAPYMHNGAYNTLHEVVVHYRDKGEATRAFDITKTVQAQDLGKAVTHSDGFFRRISGLTFRVPSDLTDDEIDQLVAFMETLTDPAAVNRRHEVPAQVPSGLPVDR